MSGEHFVSEGRMSRWIHFWHGFCSVFDCMALSLSHGKPSYDIAPKTKIGKGDFPTSNFNADLAAIGNDMRKVMTDLDHVIQRELSKQEKAEVKQK